ncbi:MAG: FixH family protein [Elusimicrobiota bacterium]|nr:MAG: FixH family protein [Elusimicrobiota bacterium]
MKNAGPVLILSALALSGCAAVTPYDIAETSQGVLYRYNLEGVEEAVPPTPERVAGAYAVRLLMTPSPATAQDQVRISFLIEDRSQVPAKAVTGARVACKVGMPRVAGHLHDFGAHKDHEETAPGRYDMPPINFGMGGRWDIVFQAILPDGRQFYGTYPVQVNGPPWPQSAKPASALKPMGTLYGR